MGKGCAAPPSPEPSSFTGTCSHRAAPSPEPSTSTGDCPRRAAKREPSTWLSRAGWLGQGEGHCGSVTCPHVWEEPWPHTTLPSLPTSKSGAQSCGKLWSHYSTHLHVCAQPTKILLRVRRLSQFDFYIKFYIFMFVSFIYTTYVL